MSHDSEPLHPLERRRREAAQQPEAELPPPPPPVSWSERWDDIRQMWSVWVLIIVNLAIFVVGGIDGDNIGIRARQGGLNPLLVIEGGQYWRLVTAMFLHGSLIHIGLNMLSLHNIGSWVVGLFGHVRFWAVYLLSGLGGSVMGTLMAAPNVFSVGASGAIFGLIGALIVFFYRHNDLLDEQSRAVRGSLVFSAIATLMVGLAPGSILDNWGHLGGFLTGAALGYGILPHFQRFRAVHPETGEAVMGVRNIANVTAQRAFFAYTVLALVGVFIVTLAIR